MTVLTLSDGPLTDAAWILQAEPIATLHNLTSSSVEMPDQISEKKKIASLEMRRMSQRFMTE